MAKVRTFILHEKRGPYDLEIAEFITDCEKEFYVNVHTTYIPFPTPRVMVVVSKLDTKE